MAMLRSGARGTAGQGHIEVSRIALGCAGLSGARSTAEFNDEACARGVAAIAAAMDVGITLFDFADIYGNGTSEMVWKQALQDVPGLRERAVVCTKAAVRRAQDGAPYHYNAGFDHLHRALEGSLGRLGVDRVDLLLVHRPDPLSHPRDTARALGALVRSGKVGAVGVSNYTPSQLRALAAFMEVPLAASQPSFSLWNVAAVEDGTLDICEELGLLPMAYSPLGGGLLPGKRELPEGDPRRARLGALQVELVRCAAGQGCTPNQVALAWLMAHPAGVVPIVGSRSPEHIREAAGACAVQLSREDWFRLWVAGRGAPIP